MAWWTSGSICTRKQDLASTGFRSAHRPARSGSLYRLRYPNFSESEKSKHFNVLISISAHERKPTIGVNVSILHILSVRTLLFCSLLIWSQLFMTKMFVVTQLNELKSPYIFPSVYVELRSEKDVIFLASCRSDYVFEHNSIRNDFSFLTWSSPFVYVIPRHSCKSGVICTLHASSCVQLCRFF